MKTAFRSTALAIILLALTGLSDAHAACTSPDGGPGSITWNNVDAIIWCDGTNWNSLASSGGGGITDLTGDVTAAGTGSVAATISANAVTTAKINNAAVTTAKVADANISYAKIQNVSASKILGRYGPGAGVVQELTIGTGLALNTTTGELTGGGGGITGLTGDVTASGTGSVAATIANSAVTYAKLQNTSAASMLLGRGAGAGAGNVQELTLGSGLLLSGTTLSATASGTVSGTTGKSARFTTASTVGNGAFTDDGTNAGMGLTPKASTTSPLQIGGDIALNVSGSATALHMNGYYDTGWKAYSTGFSGALRFDSTSGQLQFWTSPASVAADAASNLGHRMTILANGNVGIGATSPGEKLVVAGNIGLTGGSKVDSNSYLTLQSGAGQAFTINTGGANERLRIDSNGNVGIGTSAPTAGNANVGLLHLNGTDGGQMHLTSSASGALGTDGSIITHYSDNSLYINNFENASINFVNNGAERMRITPSGNVGIGTTAPGFSNIVGRAYLTIKGSTNAGVLELMTGAADADQAGVGVIQFSDTNTTATTEKRIAAIGGTLDGATANLRGGALRFLTRANNTDVSLSERMRIDNIGNVGIGTMTPNAPLEIKGAAAGGEGLRISNGTASEGGQLSLMDASGAGAWEIDNNGTGPTANFRIFRDKGVNNTNALVLTPLGNVGIGTGTPTYPMDVASSTQTAIRARTTANGVAAIYATANSASSYGALIENSSSSYYCYIGYLNTYSIVCSGPGSVPSDRRLKKDIADLSNAQGLDAVMKLRPISYHWKDTKKGHRLEYGFIAQEVQKILPDLVGLVTPTTDAEKAEAEGGDLFTMQYEGLISPLVKAVQELKADNDNLRAALKAANEDDAVQNAAIDQLRHEIGAMKSAR